MKKGLVSINNIRKIPQVMSLDYHLNPVCNKILCRIIGHILTTNYIILFFLIRLTTRNVEFESQIWNNTNYILYVYIYIYIYIYSRTKCNTPFAHIKNEFHM